MASPNFRNEVLRISASKKFGENMASRKLNVLLHAFTGEAETLQSGSSGICK